MAEAVVLEGDLAVWLVVVVVRAVAAVVAAVTQRMAGRLGGYRTGRGHRLRWERRYQRLTRCLTMASMTGVRGRTFHSMVRQRRTCRWASSWRLGLLSTRCNRLLMMCPQRGRLRPTPSLRPCPSRFLR